MGRPAPGYRNETTGDLEYGVEDNTDRALLSAFNQGGDQNGGQMPSASATDTAAAALSHYQMGDQSFQSQGSTGDAPYGDTSYIDHSLKEHSPSQGQGQGPVSGHSPTGNTPGKPTVGSDEWHKVRRDNHKEGTFLPNTQVLTDTIPLRTAGIPSPSTSDDRLRSISSNSFLKIARFWSSRSEVESAQQQGLLHQP